MSFRPNVVYLHAHDAGRIVQPYGYPVETPRLMEFAREGVLFRKAFCVAPTCAPSRVGLATGRYPHQVGMFGLPHEGWRLSDFGLHWVNLLGGLGYERVLAGVQHECVRGDLPRLGYDRVLSTRGREGEFFPETLDLLQEYLTTRASPAPFFLSVGIDEPHRDNLPRPEINLRGGGARFSKTRFYETENLDSRYTAPLPWLPDLPEVRRDVESYRKGVRIMDEYMGRVLDLLRECGLLDNTVVIITSDHGTEFPGGKMTLSDQGLQVMLMMRGPAGTGLSGGRVIEPMVSHLDVLPTVLELAGGVRDPSLEGRSLLPLVRGEVSFLHPFLFAEQTHHVDRGPEPLRSVRSERFKLVRRLSDRGDRMWHDGPTTNLLRAFGWYDRPRAREELFDLYLDPMEAHDCSADPVHSGIRRDLAAALDAWLARTGDPFAQGVVPTPGSLG